MAIPYRGNAAEIGRELGLLLFVAQEIDRLETQGQLAVDEVTALRGMWRSRRWELYNRLYDTTQGQGRWRQALAAARGLARRSPQDQGAHGHLGLAALQLGDNKGAFAALRRAVALGNRDAALGSALAELYAAHGDTTEALLALWAVNGAAAPLEGRHKERADTLIAIARTEAAEAAPPPAPHRPLRDNQARLHYLIGFLETAVQTRAIGVARAATLGEAIAKREAAFRPVAAAPVLPPPVPAPSSSPAPAIAEPQAPVSPAVVAAVPPREPFNWADFWSALFSERMLRVLLYLGATLLVVSAFTWVAFNWQRFSPPGQLAVLVGITGGFYLGGARLRSRYNLARSGMALTAIGAGWVPMIGWALARPGLLDLVPGQSWLLISALCLLAYTLSLWRLRAEFFSALTALSAISLLLASLHLAAVTPSAQGAALLLLLTLLVALAWWIRTIPDSQQLAAPLIWIAHGLAPIVLLGGALVWRGGAPADQLLLALNWWLGCGFYLLSLRLLGGIGFEQAAVWIAPAALLFSLEASQVVPPAWYGALLLTLSPIYLWAAGQRRTIYLATSRPWLRYPLVWPTYSAAYLLALLALVWPGQTTASGLAVALGVTALCAASAWIFRQSVWAWLACLPGLLAGEYLLSLLSLDVQGQVIGWTLIAITFWLVGVVLERAPRYGLAPLTVGYAVAGQSLIAAIVLSPSSERVVLPLVGALLLASGLLWQSGLRGRWGYRALVGNAAPICTGASFALAAGLWAAWPWLFVSARVAAELVGFGQLLLAGGYLLGAVALRGPSTNIARRVLNGAGLALLFLMPVLLWLSGDQTVLIALLVALGGGVALIWPTSPTVTFKLPWQPNELPAARITPLDLLAVTGSLALLPFVVLRTEREGLLALLLVAMGALLLGSGLLHKRAAGLYAAGGPLLAASLIALRWLDFTPASQSAGLTVFALLALAAGLFCERRGAPDAALACHGYGYGSAFVAFGWGVAIWSSGWLQAPWELVPTFVTLAAAAFVLTLCYRSPLLGALTVALGLPAFLISASALRVPGEWYSLAVATLTALYVALALLQRRGWLHGQALFATPLFYGGHGLAVLALLLGTPISGEAAVATLLLALVYAVVAATQRSPLLATVPALLLPFSAMQGWGAYGEATFGKASHSVLWLALSCLLLGIGLLLRRRGAARYSISFYTVALALGVYAPFWATNDRVMLLAALAGQVVLWIGSATLVERRGLLPPDLLPHAARRLLTRLLLVPVAPLASFWFVLLCDTLGIASGPVGLGLALLGLLWLLVGRVVQRIDAALPFAITALGVSILAPLVSGGTPFHLLLLGLNLVAYLLIQRLARTPLVAIPVGALLVPLLAALTLIIFWQPFSAWLPPVLLVAVIVSSGMRLLDRRPFWSVLLPFGLPPLLLLSLATYQPFAGWPWLVEPGATASALVIFACVSFGLSWWLQRARPTLRLTRAFDTAAACCGIWIACFDLQLLGNPRTPFTTLALLVLVPLYALYAVRFRAPVWLYAALAAALLLRTDLPALIGVPLPWRGVALLAGTLLFFGMGYLLHVRGGQGRSSKHPDRWFDQTDGLAWGLPLYLMAHLWALRAVERSLDFAWPLAASLAGVTLLYATSALLWRSRGWQLAALLVGQAAYAAMLNAFGWLDTSSEIALGLLPLGLLLAAAGLLAEWQNAPHTINTTRRGIPASFLLFPSALAFYLVAALDLALALGFAAISGRTAVLALVAWMTALLLATLGSVWRNRVTLLGALLLSAVGSDALLVHAGFGITERIVALGLEALVFWWAGLGLRYFAPNSRRLQLWTGTLTAGGLLASGTSLALALLPLIAFGDTRPLIGALALAGLLCVGKALVERAIFLSYAGSGMLVSAWLLAVFTYLPDQPQLYALPAGCYLLAIGAAERQRGAPQRQAQLLELLGMSVLLAVSFWQSLPDNLGYGVLLGLEALLMIVIGALQRVRLLFFGGVVAFLANVAVQSISSVQQVEKSLLTFVVGLILVAAAIYVERRRDELLRRTRQLITQLESWN